MADFPYLVVQSSCTEKGLSGLAFAYWLRFLVWAQATAKECIFRVRHFENLVPPRIQNEKVMGVPLNPWPGCGSAGWLRILKGLDACNTLRGCDTDDQFVERFRGIVMDTSCIVLQEDVLLVRQAD